MLNVPVPDETVPEATVPVEEGRIPEVVAAFLTLDPAMLAGLDKCSLEDTGRSNVRLNTGRHYEES